jgi:excisionase family DNA binding protein
VISPGEAAHVLRVSPRWVYRAASAGYLPAVRLGPGVRAPLRIKRTDLAALLREAGEHE